MSRRSVERCVLAEGDLERIYAGALAEHELRDIPESLTVEDVLALVHEIVHLRHGIPIGTAYDARAVMRYLRSKEHAEASSTETEEAEEAEEAAGVVHYFGRSILVGWGDALRALHVTMPGDSFEARTLREIACAFEILVRDADRAPILQTRDVVLERGARLKGSDSIACDPLVRERRCALQDEVYAAAGCFEPIGRVVDAERLELAQASITLDHLARILVRLDELEAGR